MQECNLIALSLGISRQYTFLQRRGANMRTDIRKMFYLCRCRESHRGELRRALEDASTLLLVRPIMATHSGKWSLRDESFQFLHRETTARHRGTFLERCSFRDPVPFQIPFPLAVR